MYVMKNENYAAFIGEKSPVFAVVMIIIIVIVIIFQFVNFRTVNSLEVTTHVD